MDIDVKELKQKFENKEEFVFIDVREDYEYNEFNLGAQLIPLGTLPAKLADLADKKGEEIVVHCRSGARSGQAQAFMQQNGFTNVRNLTGGVLAWVDAYGAIRPV